ncbi:hypothetical protein D3C80_1698860 [compost metagenome]
MDFFEVETQFVGVECAFFTVVEIALELVENLCRSDKSTQCSQELQAVGADFWDYAFGGQCINGEFGVSGFDCHMIFG